MKKSTLILIAIVYIASIVLISIFGMKSVVYNEIIPVTEIKCLNETDRNSTVKYNGDTKIIEVAFGGYNEENPLAGTTLTIIWRVLPDNASNKGVKFVYDESFNDRVEFVKDDEGNELGMIIFKSKVVMPLRIMSIDGTKVFTEIVVWAK